MKIEDVIEYVYGDLRNRNAMLAVAESLTGGRVQALLTGVSGASDVFAGGVTTYATDAKVTLLNVDRDSAEACDAVSERTAREMVAGVCEMFGVECGIATTGYAEATDAIPKPFAWIAVSVNGSVVAERVAAEGSRQDVQQAFAEQAVCLLQSTLSAK